MPPSFVWLNKIGKICTSAHEVLSELEINFNEDMVEEYKRVRVDLQRRYEISRLDYHIDYGLGLRSSELLYLIVRATRPKTVFETGVGNGQSSFVILSAIERNGVGQLHSTDISKKVGVLVDEPRAQNWHLHIMNTLTWKRELSMLLDSVGTVDFFVHDSDHKYSSQIFEYKLAYPKVAKNGLFASDDINDSYAYGDFATRMEARPLILIDEHKLFGILRKPM